MNEKNAMDILALPNVDGGLIGGASLNADSFLTIIDAAHKIQGDKKDNPSFYVLHNNK